MQTTINIQKQPCNSDYQSADSKYMFVFSFLA